MGRIRQVNPSRYLVDGKKMESSKPGISLSFCLSRSLAPVLPCPCVPVETWGQVDGCVLLQDTAPEDCQFYIVAQGSRLTHVTTAKRGSDERTFCFTVPGHDRVEVVSVTAYISTNDGVYPYGSKASLEYFRDDAQEAAEYLSGNWDQFGHQSCQEVLRRFPVLVQAADEELCGGLLACRERETQLRGSSGDGLRHLDQKITLALANMDYPQQWKNSDWEPGEGAEHHPKETLLHLAGPGSSLRGCRRPASSRERLKDHRVCRQINILRVDAGDYKSHKNEAHLNDRSGTKELNIDGNVLVDNVFEDQPTLFLIDTDSEEENSSSLSGNSSPSTSE
ncbi:hypothetical protein CRENBAI_013601 [Crenichthys baileyi]|uniref:Uncharacterized protein n=1 Tax=Crenichthys baileyi TaxID=28760 RepID=A0AAV9RYA7_9TELE